MLVVTKDVLAAGSTRWAQGGIAAALGPDDTAEAHLSDTLVAGVGLCDVEAVRVLVDEGPQAVRELIELGARFDRSATGELALTREGGHHADRIAHAGGDATGAEIERALVAAVLATPGIEVIEHALVLDLLPTAAGGVGGGHPARDGRGPARRGGRRPGPGLRARHRRHRPGVRRHHQPAGLHRGRGGGGAAGRRGGRATWSSCSSTRPCCGWAAAPPASSRWSARRCAARARCCVDDSGTRFMRGQHELADLAPRDVVAKAILRRMRETGAEHVWLDARHFGAEKWRVRFPTILATLTSLGLDPVTQLIPVAPACHYASGGIATDLAGRTSVRRAVRLRRGGLHGGARRQPAGLELAAGGAGVRPADRRGRAAHRAPGPAAGRAGHRRARAAASPRPASARRCSGPCRPTPA